MMPGASPRYSIRDGIRTISPPTRSPAGLPWREGRPSALLALSRAAPRRLRGRVEADEVLHRRGEPLAQFPGLDNLGVGAERDQTGRGPLDRLDRDRDADPAVGVRRRRRLGGRPGDE